MRWSTASAIPHYKDDANPLPPGAGFYLVKVYERRMGKLCALHRKTIVHMGNYTILHFAENRH